MIIWKKRAAAKADQCVFAPAIHTRLYVFILIYDAFSGFRSGSTSYAFAWVVLFAVLFTDYVCYST